jgi:hypothetical protein
MTEASTAVSRLKSPEVGLPSQETLALMRSPDLAVADASLAAPRRAQRCRREVRIRSQFALFRSCINAHERRNRLFAGSEAGGRRAAQFYTLIESAKRNGVNPSAYLRHVLTELPSATAADLDALLPWNFQPLPEAEATI